MKTNAIIYLKSKKYLSAILMLAQKLNGDIIFGLFRDLSTWISLPIIVHRVPIYQASDLTEKSTHILKVHKRENFLGSDIEICTFS